ncbi:unannotated protein [freshwater metagenome]|uniref:Unannotated protein n=1 Tax=freshwater metagenome TaxID=449393 RepID=A0A6J7IUV3_9ZZZZ
MLLCVHACKGQGDVAVEVPEEWVDPRDSLGVKALAQRVFSTLGSVSWEPDECRSLNAVPRRAIRLLGNPCQEAAFVEDAEHVLDDCLGVIGIEVRTDAAGASQVPAKRAKPRHEHIAPWHAGRALRRVQGSDLWDAFALRQRPRLDEVLARVTGQPLKALLGQGIDVNAQGSAQLVHEQLEQFSTLGIRQSRELRVGTHPGLRVSSYFRKIRIIDAEQPGLLEIGHGDSPAALEIGVDPVLDHLPQCSFGLILCCELGMRVRCEVDHLQAHRPAYVLGD